jgi:RimJ/RimL family protein N-acetyltransferase
MVETQTQYFYLKKADKSDYGFFYDLLKERDASVNISHQEMPTRAKSDKFNASKPYAYDFVIMDGERIGRVYITRNNEIGISIKKEFQGKHYGTKTIKLLMEKTKLKKYYANINPLNIKSQEFFKKLGFKLVQYTYARILKKD